MSDTTMGATGATGPIVTDTLIGDGYTPPVILDPNALMPDETRPWHGTENPYEAIYQWFKGELAALEERLGGGSSKGKSKG